MSDDAEITLIALALVLTFVGVVFTIATVRWHNDEAGRLWSAGALAAMAAVDFSAIWGDAADPPRMLRATVAGAMVLAVGMLWAGVVAFNRRPAQPERIGAAAIGAFAITAVDHTTAAAVFGNVVVVLLVSAFAGLAAFELRRSTTSARFSRAALLVLLAVVALAGVLTGITSAVVGERTRLTDRVESEALPVVVGLVVIATIACLSAMRRRRLGVWWAGGERMPENRQLGLLPEKPFGEEARSLIDAEVAAGGHVGLVLARINDLEELTAAFGSQAGNEAMINLTDLIRSQVTVSALLGHFNDGTFAIVTSVESAADVRAIVAGVRAGLIDPRRAPSNGVRVGAAFGLADSFTTIGSYDELLARAQFLLFASRA